MYGDRLRARLRPVLSGFRRNPRTGPGGDHTGDGSDRRDGPRDGPRDGEKRPQGVRTGSAVGWTAPARVPGMGDNPGLVPSYGRDSLPVPRQSIRSPKCIS